MIAGRGAVWQTVTENYAEYLIALVRLLAGESVPTDIANGRYLVESMRQLGSGRTASREILDAPLRAPAASRRSPRRGGRARSHSRLWRGVVHAGRRTDDRSRDPDRPGVLDVAARRLLEGRVLGDGSNRQGDSASNASAAPTSKAGS